MKRLPPSTRRSGVIPTGLAGALAGALLILAPDAGHATIIASQEAIPPGCSLCTQSINFGANPDIGTTVTDDTNPPPVYHVSATSPTVLDASGSNIAADTAAGFNSIAIYPVVGSGWAWSAFEFQLDWISSTGVKPPTAPSSGLTITGYDQFGTATSTALDFPWEGNNGENQHYLVTASNGEVITKVLISYTDPTGSGGMIQDIHNMDVGSVFVPEPASIALLGVGLAGLGLVYRRKRM